MNSNDMLLIIASAVGNVNEKNVIGRMAVARIAYRNSRASHIAKAMMPEVISNVAMLEAL